MKLDEKWLREHLPGFERYTGLMNRWFLEPHWAYDEEKFRFIEISDSREYRSDSDKTDAVTQDNVIGLVD